MTSSNRQKAEDYYLACKRFIKTRLSEKTLSFSAEGKIIRSEIYEAINASRGVMNQNPRIKRLLLATERWARMRRIITAMASQNSNKSWRASGAGDTTAMQMQARLNYLEKQVAALTVENYELRRSVKRAEWIDKILSASGSTQGTLPW
jgi:hypothetical protein